MTIRPGDVGGASDPQIIVDVARDQALQLPDEPAGGPLAAPARVIEILGRWMDQSQTDLGPKPIVFVVVPSIREVSGQQIPLFNTPGERSLSAGSVYACCHGLWEAVLLASNSPTIDEAVESIATLGYASMPTAVFAPQQRRLTWYPEGLCGSKDEVVEVEIRSQGRSEVSAASVKSLLDHIYTTHWASPTAGSRHWHDSAGFIPVESTERVFQDQVVLSCKATFREHAVFAEVNLPTGRCDVLLFPKTDLPEAQGRGVIEMKVLRAFSFAIAPLAAAAVSAYSNRAAVCKGVKQARSYGDDNGCHARVLCVCDMRRENEDSILDPYRGFAATHGITMLRYFIYNSSDAARDASAAAAGFPG